LIHEDYGQIESDLIEAQPSSGYPLDWQIPGAIDEQVPG
jgi:hypothetical protein